ncbi:MAG: LytTR family DNA-binding domain-containing protein [Candidatus Sulfopaludibacter sp.]|nr:LytTR family DNA-binding domain-containing protein [Candidatus Sulfopaludibacter sp.]
MRVLIVDDEAPARARLRQMLASQPDAEIAGEAETGVQAMELAAALHPDLILLDIQMPGCTGIDVAACLPPPRPHIIFCTAFDQYAVDAFELRAVDYLLKPITRARLAQALDRVRAFPPGEDRDQALDLATRQPRFPPSRFLARSGSRYLVVGESQVLYFASEEGLTRLVGDTAQYWMDPTLNDLEKRLDPARFFRISRHALVNLNAVTEVFPLPGGSGEVALKNGQRLEVSRRRFRDLLAALA